MIRSSRSRVRLRERLRQFKNAGLTQTGMDVARRACGRACGLITSQQAFKRVASVRNTIQSRFNEKSEAFSARIPGLDNTGLIAHLGMSVSLASFAMSDMTSLRTLALCGNGIWMLNAVTRRPVPLMSISWQLVFLGINGTMLVLLLNDERTVDFDSETNHLYETHFLPIGSNRRNFRS